MSQVLNFASFTVQKSANERSSSAGVPRGQNFKMKFRKFNTNKGGVAKVDTAFTLSNDKFAELQLETYGIVQLNAPEGDTNVYLAVVGNEDATLVKRTEKLAADAEKGRKFKSTILEKALMEAGVIEDKEGVTQMLDLVSVSGATKIGDLEVQGIYSIVKGEDIRSDEEKKEDDSAEDKEESNNPETLQAPEPEAESPQPEVEDEDTF